MNSLSKIRSQTKIHLQFNEIQQSGKITKNQQITENLKIKQVQLKTLATSSHSACSKLIFAVETFPFVSGRASTGFQQRKVRLLSPAVQASVSNKENPHRLAKTLRQ